jgi:hypothetical protein
LANSKDRAGIPSRRQEAGYVIEPSTRYLENRHIEAAVVSLDVLVGVRPDRFVEGLVTAVWGPFEGDLLNYGVFEAFGFTFFVESESG